jgi:hypothetical protein
MGGWKVGWADGWVDGWTVDGWKGQTHSQFLHRPRLQPRGVQPQQLRQSGWLLLGIFTHPQVIETALTEGE